MRESNYMIGVFREKGRDRREGREGEGREKGRGDEEGGRKGRRRVRDLVLE